MHERTLPLKEFADAVVADECVWLCVAESINFLRNKKG
jgi:hypothetical protein